MDEADNIDDLRDHYDLDYRKAKPNRFADRINKDSPTIAKGVRSFRNVAAFGKRIEYWIIGRMLKEGLDVYVPLVDDHVVDAIVRRTDGSIALIQIKARSKEVISGDAALFAAIEHDTRSDYWFIFYSERMDTTWLLSSDEFIKEAVQNKSGKNIGKRGIWFNGTRKNRETGQREEYCKEKYLRYVVENFERLHSSPLIQQGGDGSDADGIFHTGKADC